jgi:hypothetical protein
MTSHEPVHPKPADEKHEHEKHLVPEKHEKGLGLKPTPTPLPTDDCPKRSEGGSCLCEPVCARCHAGPHMPVHDDKYAFLPGAAAYDHVFQMPDTPPAPVPKPEPKPLPKAEPKAEPKVDKDEDEDDDDEKPKRRK